jgi:hypothetical protein
MKTYKYSLDKSSRKFECPKCGKKTFVRYKNTENLQYAEPEFGRCDREINCAHLSYPDSTPSYNLEYMPSTQPKPSPKPSYISYSILDSSLKKYEINPMVKYLYSKYDSTKVDEAIRNYNVGTSTQYSGSTVYWQVDNTGQVRTGKVMAYDETTGKRAKTKDGTALINWAHNFLKIPEFIPNQCLFGLHLLKKDKKPIAVVESEKTAIIMSLELPNITWMATGSLNGFKHDYLKPLKDSKIIAFPDKGGYEMWLKTAKDLNKMGFNIKVSKELERPNFEDGWDLADVINSANEIFQ